MLKDSIAFSGISVTTIDTALTFYRDTLGLNVKEIPEGLELHLTNGLNIFLYPKGDHVPATYTVLNFLVADIDQAADELIGKGVQFERYDIPYMQSDAKGIYRGDNSVPHPGPQAMAWFKDPAGNILALIQK